MPQPWPKNSWKIGVFDFDSRIQTFVFFCFCSYFSFLSGFFPGGEVQFSNLFSLSSGCHFLIQPAVISLLYRFVSSSSSSSSSGLSWARDLVRFCLIIILMPIPTEHPSFLKINLHSQFLGRPNSLAPICQRSLLPRFGAVRLSQSKSSYEPNVQ